MKRVILTGLIVFAVMVSGRAQVVTLDENIRSIKLYRAGDQVSFPSISLGSLEGLELHFDDMANRVKNYYYTFQLCNADWSPSILRPFEYIKGFQNVRITTYRNSSLATAKYMHYQATVPDRNCYPSRSGNYLLKVFLDNDTSKLVFTRQMIVIDNKSNVAAQILQPFNSNLFRTAHRLTIKVQTDARMQVMSPNDLKVVILQNNNWQTSLFMDRPTIYRGNYYEYSDEPTTSFQALKEFRWLDLRSLRLRSDRMEDIITKGDTTEVVARPDLARGEQVYVYFRDFNGSYFFETLENVNPFWQGDYAKVHFTYVPAGNKAVEGSDIYLFGEFTNYGQDTAAIMNFNKDKGVYEKTLYLKQGYYNYLYAARPVNGPNVFDFTSTEGNYFTTEDSYIVLVYYRPFGARADELVGFAQMNSLFNQR